MKATVRRVLVGVAAAVIVAGGIAASMFALESSEGKRPELKLRANPKIAFVPAKVQFTAVLEGGADDYQEFYCPTIEWDWDDDTTSESTPDCEPYEAGKSRIVRRYSAQHTFRFDGLYDVEFRLKQRDRTIATMTIPVEIRGGH